MAYCRKKSRYLTKIKNFPFCISAEVVFWADDEQKSTIDLIYIQLGTCTKTVRRGHDIFYFSCDHSLPSWSFLPPPDRKRKQ